MLPIALWQVLYVQFPAQRAHHLPRSADRAVCQEQRWFYDRRDLNPGSHAGRTNTGGFSRITGTSPRITSISTRTISTNIHHKPCCPH
jgi:transposase-like protein